MMYTPSLGHSALCAPDPAWSQFIDLAIRAVHDPSPLALREFHQQVAIAELAGQLSEFYALGLQAILAVGESPEVVDDYFGMAELVADPIELALVAHWRRTWSDAQEYVGQPASEAACVPLARPNAHLLFVLEQIRASWALVDAPTHRADCETRAA